MALDDAACGKLSLMEPIGYQCNSCGYCKNDETSQRTPNSRGSYYALTKSLCPKVYQMLLDRGWRRSGETLYIPDASRSCCPHYTIRLPASDFTPNRDQRQALNRWNRHVLGEQYSIELTTKYPTSKADKKKANNTFDLIKTIHESEQKYLKTDIHPSAHRFEISLEEDTYSEEKFALFENYQRNVHKEGPDDITRNGFRRFLCNSPLHRHKIDKTKQLGSYHQCYRLDGQLVAMGVLDLLPHAVSAVYFMYHETLEQWSPGKLSALRETALTLEGGYQYYYMGYYIHSCLKMRYKGHYRPQYVLDFISGQWDLLDDEMRTLMEEKKFVSMSCERARKKSQTDSKMALDENISTRAPEPPKDETKRDNNGDDIPEPEPEQNESATTTTTTSSDPPILHPTPLAAMTSHLPLTSLSMPGILPLANLLSTLDLDTINVYFGARGGGDGGVYEMQDIVSWQTGSPTNPRSLKGNVADFAAAVGVEVVKAVAVDFSPRR